MSRATTAVGALELRDLRYFAAAARTGNLGRAAQELGVTAPAVSQQLRKLEDEFGTQLLIRHARGVTPTPAGDRLLQRLDTILRLLNAPLEFPADCAETGGPVSLAMPAEFAGVLAAPVLQQVRKLSPRVTLELKESIGGAAESWLLDRAADIAVLQDAPTLDEFQVTQVLSDGLGLVMSPRHPLAQTSQPLRLREVAGVPLILPNPRHWVRRQLARTGFQRGVRFDPAFEVESLSITREMIRNDMGCGILPPVAVRDEIQRGALVFRPIEQLSHSTAHAVAVCQPAPHLVRAVADAVVDAMRTLAADGTWPGARLVRPDARRAAAATDPNLLPEAWRLLPLEAVRNSVEFVEGD